MHRIDWSEQVVLVTGGIYIYIYARPFKLQVLIRTSYTGSQGLGKSIVEILDTKKVSVVVLDLHAPKASSSEYNDVHFYQCDVSDFKQVQEAAERVRKEVGILAAVILSQDCHY